MKEQRVKKIYITNRPLFEEIFIRELIKNNISYLQIEHEFHVFDKIYRFVERKVEYQEEYYNLNLNEIEFILSQPVDEEPKVKNPIYKHKPKKLIKQQNHMLNQLLKRNKI